jgi:hypothetical protein
MLTTNRFAANKANAKRSTGPRTAAGKAASAANSLKGGLFSRRFVIPAIGESVEAWDEFRAGVVAALDADSVLELELAGRVAQILWRTRRVGVYEAAATTPASLPPHPDEVAPATGDRYAPLPVTATTADKLARVRARMPAVRNAEISWRDALNVALRVGQVDDDSPLDNGPVFAVLDAVGDVLGFDRYTEPSPWMGVLGDLGVKCANYDRVAWTATIMNRVIDLAATTCGRTVADVTEQVVAVLRSEVMESGETVRHRETEETELVEALLAERSVAAARALYADDAVVQRVTRVEGHLSRELDRALAALERVRAMRAERTTPPVDQVELGSFCKTARRN